jgi:hypothetical protein
MKIGEIFGRNFGFTLKLTAACRRPIAVPVGGSCPLANFAILFGGGKMAPGLKWRRHLLRQNFRSKYNVTEGCSSRTGS